jgi:hypothetical protein
MAHLSAWVTGTRHLSCYTLARLDESPARASGAAVLLSGLSADCRALEATAETLNAPLRGTFTRILPEWRDGRFDTFEIEREMTLFAPPA